MTGKRLDIWGLPIDDEPSPQADSVVAPVGGGDAVEPDISAAEVAAAGGEAAVERMGVAEAKQAGAVDPWLAAYAPPPPASAESAAEIPATVTPATEIPAAETSAPAAPAPEVPAPDMTAAATATLAAQAAPVTEVNAPEKATVSSESAPTAGVADARAVSAPVAPAPVEPAPAAAAAAVAAVAAPATQPPAPVTAQAPDIAPALAQRESVAAALPVVAEAAPAEAAAAEAGAPAMAEELPEANDPEPEQEVVPDARPAPAWIPPERKKKKSQAMLAAAGAQSVSAPAASTQAAGVPVGGELQTTSMPTGSTTDATGARSEEQSRPPAVVGGLVAPSAAAAASESLPVIPPATNAPAYAPPPVTKSLHTDDFWGVPPGAAVAQGGLGTAGGLSAATAVPPSSVASSSVPQASVSPSSIDARPDAASANPTAGMSAPARRTFFNRATPMSTSTTSAASSSAALATSAPEVVGALAPGTFVPSEPRAALPAAQARAGVRGPSEGHIEVVNPEGWKRDYPLRRSILYVGSAPGADILLPAGEIAPRHLQFVPSSANRIGYRLINLGSAAVTVKGALSAEARVAAPRASLELADGDRVEVGGYALVFHNGEMTSGLIQVRLEVPNPRLAFDKPLDGALYIRNGGDRAGVQFMVEVQGIDSRFVQIESGPVLFPDVEKRVAFRLTHPRTATPAAGDQPINFVVTAPEGYPGEVAIASQVVSIAPFFAHKVRLIAIEPESSGYSLSTGR